MSTVLPHDRVTPSGTGIFRLLVVDDDLATIRQLARVLVDFAQVSFATGGEDALAMARAQRPDLILLDAEMPGMNGFEVLAALRADERTAAVPVVFATSHRAPEIEAAALRLGAADFIAKPLVPSQVLARVRRQLQVREFAPTPAPTTDRAARLLIVDDDPSAIQLLQGLLAEVGEGFFALDGARALELAATVQPDLLLLDVDMPGIDGFEVCRRIKGEPRFRGLPVVFVTQHGDADQEARAFAGGADDFIGKPFDRSVLLARVRRLIDRKRRVEADLEAVRRHWQGIGDARVAELVGAASDAIVAADADDCIVLANRAACALFGLPPGRAIGRRLGDFLPAAADGASPPGRRQARRSDGETVPVEVTASTLGSGPEALRLCVIRDTRERDRQEAAARLRSEAEAARRATAQMLAFIAHEMGNSLNSVLGFTELIRTDDSAPLPPVQAERIGHIAQSAARLDSLMRDVIDLSRLETRRFRVELARVDPAAAVRAVCAELAEQARRAGARLRLQLPDEPGAAMADARRLHQCLHNLVSNAIKYGRPAGSVDIAVRERGTDVVIEVRDAGCGLSAEQLAHLFEPFNRLGRDAGGAPGSGLGLLLTRELAQAMGGALEVASEPGRGSCFALRLLRATPRD